MINDSYFEETAFTAFTTYNNHPVKLDHGAEFDLVDIGNGFQVQSLNKNHLEKHGLLGKGVLHFMNHLCELVDNHHDTFPSGEWDSLAYTLNDFMMKHKAGELYYYMIHAFGPNALNLNAWAHFTLDMDWFICLRAFKDMPTHMLEEYGAKIWRYRFGTMGEDGMNQFYEVISERTDEYGQLPRDMVEGILYK